MGTFSPRLLQILTQEDAGRELAKVGVDPGGIPMMLPKMRTHCIKLSELSCGQANILKQEMLSLGGDAAVARGTVACSIPNTDVILIGTDKQLQRLCSKLNYQPFGLADLAHSIKSLLETSVHTPKKWKTSKREFNLVRPLIMGIVNITPDSFSDGNQYFDPEAAIDHGLKMADEGADIIDIGGESTRPGAQPVTPDEEIKRIIPVISALSTRVSCAISVDTWKSEVASAAIDAGAEIVNDISGFHFDKQMAPLVAKQKTAAVLMHTRGNPQTMQQDTHYNDVISEVYATLNISVETALNADIDHSCIAIDPGIGFGKDAGHNLEILRRLEEFKGMGLPILVGSSRKSFIGKTLNRQIDDRIFGTAATVALAIANGAQILRVHDVRAMRDVADMSHAISFNNFSNE